MLNESHLYREIFEQPSAIERFLSQQLEPVTAVAQAIKQRNIDHVVIAARGTSDNAGRYAKYLLGSVNGLQVALATPSLFSLYAKPITFGNALVLGISQSGQSPDIVSVLAEAKRQGKLTAAITNFADSPLAHEADFVIELCAGTEMAVAATKTYTNSLAAIALLSAVLADEAAMTEALVDIPTAMAQTLTMADAIAAIAPRYRYMQHCVVIGRGLNYATAFETALKMKELTYTIVEPYSSADFLHGPFALINEGFPVLMIAPQGALSAEMVSFLGKVNAASAESIVITDDDTLLNQATIPLALPATVPEWVSPLTAILPGQLLSMYLAHARGLNVDTPRSLNKVTHTM